MNQLNKQPDASSHKEEGGDEVEKLRDGIDQTRAHMSETLRALEDRLAPADLRSKAATELEHVEVHVKAAIKEQLVEVRSILKDEIQEAKQAVDELLEKTREGVKRDVVAAKDAVKRDVGEALTNVKSEIRAATLGRLETAATRTGEIMSTTRDTFVDTIRHNPVPAALAGLGIAWLFLNRSRMGAGSESSTNTSGIRVTLDHAGEVVRRVEDRAMAMAHDATDAAGHAVGQASAFVGGAAGDMSRKASEIAHAAGKTVSDIAHDLPARAQRAEKVAENAFFDHPLAVGAAIVAAGALIGLALPRTTREDSLMGHSRDRVMSAARDAAHNAAEVVRNASKDVASNATKALSNNATGVNALSNNSHG